MRMPEVLANATEAIIAKWLVEEGATFSVGQPLAEAETEKALVEVPAEIDGVLGRKLARDGATISVGAPIAVLLVAGEGDAEIERILASENISSVPSNENADIAPATVLAPVGTTVAPERVFSSPLARKLAKENGIDPVSLRGSGPGGRIVKRDIEAFITSGSAAKPTPAAPVYLSSGTGSFTSTPHTPMRRAIARRLTESKSSVPHFYLSAPCLADDLLNMRKKLNEWSERKVSVTDLILRTVSAAFSDVPDANVIWTADEIRRFDNVDVAVAVATDSGLVTPVVRAINKMNLSQLSATTQDLIARARIGRLKQNEIEGGTFSITNLGMYGTDEFFAILNPPQSAILAVGAAKQKPVVVDGLITVASVINFTLSVDHRAIDGALAAQWLAAFVKRFENPMWLVV
ncbi:MAG: dihydrolipoamide acetyltransferase family protein [Candidatus Nanopelagicaceae bacterium]